MTRRTVSGLKNGAGVPAQGHRFARESPVLSLFSLVFLSNPPAASPVSRHYLTGTVFAKEGFYGNPVHLVANFRRRRPVTPGDISFRCGSEVWKTPPPGRCEPT